MSAFDRGYSIAMHGGRELRSTNEVAAGDEIEIILKDGTINACVTGSKNMPEKDLEAYLDELKQISEKYLMRILALRMPFPSIKRDGRRG